MMSMPDLPWTIETAGILLAVRATPRAKGSEVSGIVTGPDGRAALAVRLAARPVEGAANKALTDFIAALLGTAKSKVKIRSGETARLKVVAISGHPETLAARLLEALGKTAAGA